MASDDTVPAADAVPAPEELDPSLSTPDAIAASAPAPSVTHETSCPPLIQTASSVSISAPDSPGHRPAVVLTNLGPALTDTPLSVEIMPESLYSVSTDSDGHSDCEGIAEAKYHQAYTVRLVNPGRASIVDLMREDKPVFRRASQVILSRPLTRPFISPIQPRHRRDTSSDDSSTYSRDTPSHSSSTPSLHSMPTTPTSEHSDDVLFCSPSSEVAISCGLDTPTTFIDHGPDVRAACPTSPSPMPDTSLKSRVRLPSRLRLFPRRCSVITSDLDPQLAHYQATASSDKHSAMSTKSTSDFATPRQYFRKANSPLDRSSFVQLIRGPPSPSMIMGEALPTARQAQFADATMASAVVAKNEVALPPTPPVRSMWRETGRSRAFLGNPLRKIEGTTG